MLQHNYKAEFEAIRELVEATDYKPAIAAIVDAETNANETDGVSIGSDAWFECAYLSIGFCSAFTENETVRKVFRSFGYRG